MDQLNFPARESESLTTANRIIIPLLLEVLFYSKFVIPDETFRIKETDAAWVFWISWKAVSFELWAIETTA